MPPHRVATTTDIRFSHPHAIVRTPIEGCGAILRAEIRSLAAIEPRGRRTTDEELLDRLSRACRASLEPTDTLILGAPNHLMMTFPRLVDVERVLAVADSLLTLATRCGAGSHRSTLSLTIDIVFARTRAGAS